MINSFYGLEMGKRALNAFRQGIDVAGHNMMNVKTEGYSRQRVDLSSTFYTPSAPPGQIGTGVQIDQIKRIRDEFLDFQYRSELSELGYWSKINGLYETVQLYIVEPTSSTSGVKGIRAHFDAFWKSLQTLQTNPEQAAAREAVVQAAKSLGTQLDTLVQGYDQYASIVNEEVKSYVDQANAMLHEVAALNRQIYTAKGMGQNPNDLLDKRDLLLDKLTEMLGVDIQEPFANDDVMGEFFITLNGRTLVQGDQVRELVAHAFQWEGKTYYDVQVKENEFDIVEDCRVALVLATGPEGVHQLNVDRMANGLEWTVGGEDPFCLNPDGTLKTTSRSQMFTDGVILPAGNPGDSHSFQLSSNGHTVTFTSTWNGTNWVLSNDFDAASMSSATADLSVDELVSYMHGVLTAFNTANGTSLAVSANGTPPTSLTITAEASYTIVDTDNMLNMTTNYVSMRLRPTTTKESLGLLGSFRLQIGSQGTQVASKIFSNSNNPDLNPGDILGQGSNNESYTFRVGANDYQADVTVAWNSLSNRWEMTSDVFTPGTPAVLSSTDHLTVSDLAGFLKTVLPSTGDDSFTVMEGGTPATRFSISSDNNYLLTISDVHGDLAAQMSMVETNPVITIDIKETDSLEIIRNKINEKYQEAYGLTNPEQWVHASLVQDADQSWYLSISSNVAGEAQRITLMGDEDGSDQILRRLGLLKLEQTGTNGAGDPVYREVTAYSQVAEDASFTFDGVRYLSADNKFDQARKVPAGQNRSDYSASVLTTVSEGMWIELKGIGHTAITVRHHVRSGSVKALEEIRDGLIPDLKGDLDELAWSLVNSFNAYQYSGYGIGENITTTGVAFFDPRGFKSGSASALNVFTDLEGNVSLIGAAMGKLDADGKTSYGQSSGSGSGSNAARMSALRDAKLLNANSSSLGDFYEGYLARIGSEAGSASLMYKAQKNLTEQIHNQRLSVMGVNIDEEAMDLMLFNQAFNAVSRYVTTVDEMLDRLINGFGLVGR